MKKKGLNPMCIILLLGMALTLGAESQSRIAELAPLLKALQWKPPPPANADYDTSPNPGWYNPKNRQALAQFIAKYPDTEEAYLAEVWLIFAGGGAGRSPDISELKRQRARDAESLKRIIIKAASPGTARMAKMVRSCMLLDADEHAELKIQVDEILSNIREYETETDQQYLLFAKLTETPLSEFEPRLRRMRVISECHQGHLKEALALAEELEAKYPEWSKRHFRVVPMLKRGTSPYPTWEELKKAVPTLEELKKRSRTKGQN